jgi:hypothetical protein
LVADKALSSCTTAGVVAPTLAGLITQSGGCQGLDIALYRDQAGNQYNLALFSMKDPVDCIHILTQLGSDPTDFEVAAESPPSTSGLRTLPADSGMVQSFSSYGNAMLIGMGQWADGHVGDYNDLVKRVGTLMDGVSKGAGGGGTTASV